MARTRDDYRPEDKQRNADRRSTYAWLLAMAALVLVLLALWFAFGTQGTVDEPEGQAVEQPDAGEGGGRLPRGGEGP